MCPLISGSRPLLTIVVVFVSLAEAIQLFGSRARPSPANRPLSEDESVKKITFGAILPKTSLITLQRQYYKVKPSNESQS